MEDQQNPLAWVPRVHKLIVDLLAVLPHDQELLRAQLIEADSMLPYRAPELGPLIANDVRAYVAAAIERDKKTTSAGRPLAWLQDVKMIWTAYAQEFTKLAS